jgi:ornithine cyclodeaminase/alanine dehydrogenase-like protein (mu-crystallin family)
VKVPAAPGDRYVGLVRLFSTHNGEPLAIFPDGVLQHFRVGATNGLGVKYMAREDAKTVGILGSGWQAETQLAAVCTVRTIDTIRCFSPNRENRESFSQRMSESLGVPVRHVEQPEDAVRGTDIVMCATNALGPVFFKSWIEPGMHLSSIKRPEIEADAIRSTDRVVIHTHDPGPLLTVAIGADYKEEGKWKAGDLDVDKLPTLPELIDGRLSGRESDEEVTCFLNNMGLGYQFAAVGSVVYKKAIQEQMGHDLPTEWFTETVHP